VVFASVRSRVSAWFVEAACQAMNPSTMAGTAASRRSALRATIGAAAQGCKKLGDERRGDARDPFLEFTGHAPGKRFERCKQKRRCSPSWSLTSCCIDWRRLACSSDASSGVNAIAAWWCAATEAAC
jgi:hypothetical protein